MCNEKEEVEQKIKHFWKTFEQTDLLQLKKEVTMRVKSKSKGHYKPIPQ